MEQYIFLLKTEYSIAKTFREGDFPLQSTLANDGVVLDYYPYEIPDDLLIFWLNCKEAQLFEDKEYGQWGLQILSPENSLIATHEYQKSQYNQYKSNDLIIGRFIGDSELLMVSCDKGKDFGSIYVVSPIAKRKEWHLASSSFTNFIEKYIENKGDKYWI
jgi:hypothetical protein